MDIKLQGIFSALITPFKDNNIDYDSLQSLIEYQIKNGIHGFVVCGTTAESVTLSNDEYSDILKFVIDKVKSRVQLIAGVGTNNTQTTIKKAKLAEKLGYETLMVVTPYYNKPNIEGIKKHYEEILKSVSSNIILYNIPSRVVIKLSNNEVIDLANNKKIVGIKDATGCVEAPILLKKNINKSFSVLSGDDNLALPFLVCDGDGIISVASNYITKEYTELYNSILSNDIVRAKIIYKKILPFLEGCFISPNPAPIKYALSSKGIIQSDEVRLPLVTLKDSEKIIIDSILASI